MKWHVLTEASVWHRGRHWLSGGWWDHGYTHHHHHRHPLSHPHIHTLLHFHNMMHRLGCARKHTHTHTHTYCQGSSHPTAVAAPQAQLREGNAETYRESERWATWGGKKRSAERKGSVGTLSNTETLRVLTDVRLSFLMPRSSSVGNEGIPALNWDTLPRSDLDLTRNLKSFVVVFIDSEKHIHWNKIHFLTRWRLFRENQDSDLLINLIISSRFVPPPLTRARAVIMIH